jgi:hypothetical protein
MRLLDVFGQCTIFVECTPDLLGKLFEVGRFWVHTGHLGQNLVDGFQLLEACQTTPIKGFAGAAVDRIANGHAALLFDLVSLRILS